MWNLCKKYWAFCVLGCIAIGYGVVQFMHSEPIQKDRMLVVGLQSGYPPFEFMNPKGDLIGFDVDLAKIVAEKLNRRLVVKDMEFEGLILSLKQEKIDLIMSGMNITASRLKEILMVPYYGAKADHLSLVFWGEIPKGIQRLEDIEVLVNGSISVESGTIAEAYMTRYPTIHVKAFQGALAPLIDVKYRKSTANLVESDVAEYLKKQHPEITIVKVPIPAEESILGFGIGIKKINHEFYNQVSKVIEELKKSGEYKKLEDKWFKEKDNE